MMKIWHTQFVLWINLKRCAKYLVFLRLRLKSSKVKAEQSDNDAIVDDMAGKAYVEQFGLDTLERAENTMKQSRVSR